MGYRSDVTIALDKQTYERHKLLGNFPSLLSEDFMSPQDNLISRHSKEFVLFTFRDIKWYEDNPEIKEVEEFLDKLSEGLYAFVVIGEDWDDVEAKGDLWIYRLDIVREVSLDI